LGRKDRATCVESESFGLPQSAPSVEFTEGYLSRPRTESAVIKSEQRESLSIAEFKESSLPRT
jgi:hypothetical protein